MGIKQISSSPTYLESTSLVIAYGLDIYQTIRRPSQAFDILRPDFNYLALLATIVGLVIGLSVTRHFALRKQLYEAWK